MYYSDQLALLERLNIYFYLFLEKGTFIKLLKVRISVSGL